MIILEANNIWKTYGSLSVLKGVSLTLQNSELVSIVGSSGAGKSTLLHILGTLDKADQGEVIISGNKVADLSPQALATFRNKELGFVFQFHNLLPEFTALENVQIPMLISGSSFKDSETKAKMLLQKLGLHSRLSHKPSELSGGEQQRVAVARALVNDPKIIFADEPSGNLDSANSKELHKWFLNIRDEFGPSFLIVTHNENLAAISDRILTMKDGKFPTSV
jgi:lipoprotein-releasing system ATP-binding protein